MRTLGALLICASLSACSTMTATVTWQPSIAGATIVEQGTGRVIGENIAVTPYKPTAQNVTTPGCFDIYGVTAKWPSGYESSTSSIIQLCNGYRDDYRVNIPYSATNEQQSIDIPYAISYNQMLQQNAAKRAESDHLTALAITAITGAISNAVTTQNYINKPSNSPPNKTVVQSYSNGCKSDYDCRGGMQCTKAPLSSVGVCLMPVNSLGLPQPSLMPNPDSVFPNFNPAGKCQFDTDCVIGFKCDQKLKVCTR